MRFPRFGDSDTIAIIENEVTKRAPVHRLLAAALHKDTSVNLALHSIYIYIHECTRCIHDLRWPEISFRDPITRSIDFDSSINRFESTIIRLAAISAETQPHPVIDFYFWLRPRFYPPETPVSIPVSTRLRDSKHDFFLIFRSFSPDRYADRPVNEESNLAISETRKTVVAQRVRPSDLGPARGPNASRVQRSDERVA